MGGARGVAGGLILRSRRLLAAHCRAWASAAACRGWAARQAGRARTGPERACFRLARGPASARPPLPGGPQSAAIPKTDFFFPAHNRLTPPPGSVPLPSSIDRHQPLQPAALGAGLLAHSLPAPASVADKPLPPAPGVTTAAVAEICPWQPLPGHTCMGPACCSPHPCKRCRRRRRSQCRCRCRPGTTAVKGSSHGASAWRRSWRSHVFHCRSRSTLSGRRPWRSPLQVRRVQARAGGPCGECSTAQHSKAQQSTARPSLPACLPPRSLAQRWVLRAPPEQQGRHFQAVGLAVSQSKSNFVGTARGAGGREGWRKWRARVTKVPSAAPAARLARMVAQVGLQGWRGLDPDGTMGL